MGHHIGLLLWNTTSHPEEIVELLYPKAKLLSEVIDRYEAFALSSLQAAILCGDGYTVIADKTSAVSTVLEAEYPTDTSTRRALLQMSMRGDVLLVYQHSRTEQCGHLLLSEGRQVAFHIRDEQGDLCEAEGALPDWYKRVPQQYNEHYAFQAATAMLEISLQSAEFCALPWRRIEP